MDEKVHKLKKQLADLKTQLEHYEKKCKEQEVIMILKIIRDILILEY